MTKPIYEVVQGEFSKTIQKTDENGKQWSIPIDPANSDYQQYLKEMNK